MTIETWMGLASLAALPMLAWAWSIHATVKATHKMHLSPDDHGFGTIKTNELLTENIVVTRDLKHAIRELSHYTRWDTKQRTGKEPPPYVREVD